MRIGVLGIGRMGLPIARALAESGHEVSVFDADPERAAGLLAADSVAALAASADVLITVLPGPHEVEDALLGTGAALAALRPGSLWLDLSSSDPRVTERIAGFASARGIDSVGAPMGGGPTAAGSRSLTFFVGGYPRAVERARPLLEVLGILEVIGAGAGDGQVAKLLANLLWFGQAIAVTEALLLGQSLGLPPSVLRSTLATSAGGSVFIDEYLDRLLDGDYLETFGIDRCVEELDTLASLAASADVPFELSETVARLHREALARFGPVDGVLLAAKLLEERARRTLRR